MRPRLLVVAAFVVAAALAGWFFFTRQTPRVSAEPAFRDCPACPAMRPLPAGAFVMGPEPRRRDAPLVWLGLKPNPQRKITLARRFAVSETEITFDQWEACAADGGCTHRPDDEGWGRGTRPAIHVSWRDAQTYVRWLSAKTGARYRLLSESEWEYAARAGTRTAFPWGRTASHDHANYGADICCDPRAQGRDAWLHTAPVAQFQSNALGLYDMNGNVYEWVEDCYAADLSAAARDGAPLRASPCAQHVIRGAAWYSNPERIRSSYRAHAPPDKRTYAIGFRVARDF